MSPAHCFQLCVLLLWLLAANVDCKNTQRGFVLTGWIPRVHNDNRVDKRWGESRLFIESPAGYKSVGRGEKYNINPTQEEHTAHSKSSHIQSPYPRPNVVRLQSASHSASAARLRSGVLNNLKTIPGAKSGSVPPRVYAPSSKSTGFPPSMGDKVPVSFRLDNTGIPIYSHSSKAKTHPAIPSSLKSASPVFPRSFSHGRTTSLQSIFKPSNKNTGSSGNVGLPMSSPVWSPRLHRGDGMSEAKGYTHVRHLKPGFDKTRPQASSSAGRKLSAALDKGSSSSHDLTKLGFGVSVPGSSERLSNFNSRGSLFSSWRTPPPEKIHIQGKFKPFQTRTTTNVSPAYNHSLDREITVSTLPPNMTSLVTEDQRAESVSPMQGEDQDAELGPQASNLEGHLNIQQDSESSLEKNATIKVSPLKLDQRNKRQTSVF